MKMYVIKAKNRSITMTKDVIKIESIIITYFYFVFCFLIHTILQTDFPFVVTQNPTRYN